MAEVGLSVFLTRVCPPLLGLDNDEVFRDALNISENSDCLRQFATDPQCVLLVVRIAKASGDESSQAESTAQLDTSFSDPKRIIFELEMPAPVNWAGVCFLKAQPSAQLSADQPISQQLLMHNIGLLGEVCP